MSSKRGAADENALMGAAPALPTALRQDHAYRARGLPLGFTDQQTIELISRLFKLDNNTSDLRIRSLANAVTGRTMVAVLSFQTIPVELSGCGNEWSFDIGGLLQNLQADDGNKSQIRTLTVDHHFHGFTVLSSPSPRDHEVDCIAISGLGGHAFGSFKEKGGSYMWLCDELPSDLATTRIIIYGYESQLHDSQSFQDLEALATTLRTSLKSGILSAECKPVFFIAHSLGGLIVKEAIIQMRNARDHHLDSSIYGALFFGVPNQGMDIKSLIPMVENQVNQNLLHSLSAESQLLREQQREFPEAFDSRESKIVCFYETVTSPTAVKRGDKWYMDGPRAILVGSASATHGRPWENEAHDVQAINRDHSQLVKFKANDEVYERVLGTVKDFVKEASAAKRGHEVDAGELTEDDTACLKSLNFLEMGYRQEEVLDARADSCGWILEHETYQRWIDDPHGLLWVKGKPGSGKSTLMKRIFKEDAAQADVHLSFFFHRRGVQLQQTFTGMLRTMCYQLISQCAPARAIFRARYNDKKEFGRYGQDWDWREVELSQLLKSAIAVATQSHAISIFIDALDEASEGSAESIVTYIYEVHEEFQNSARRTSICFSCRHYPIVSCNAGVEVCMENQNEDDISACVHRELSAKIHERKRQSWANDLKRLQNKIANSACGVFLWASLIVPLVAKEYNKGKSLDRVLEILHKVPRDLDSIYKHILTTLIDDDDREDSLHLMQWICFAKQPLSLTELRYALALDDSAIHEFQTCIQESEGFVEDDTQMKQLITSLSGGLVEARQHYSSDLVQFIHQSVNDYLLKGGFAWIGLQSQQNIVGQGNDRLTRSCINYLKHGEVSEAEKLKLLSLYNAREEIQTMPLLQYAVRNWFIHAEAAESRGIAQNYLIQKFNWPDTHCFDLWVAISRWTNHPDELKRPELSSTLLHTAAASNLESIVQELLETGSFLEREDAEGNRPLHFAARFGHDKIIRMLLKSKADIQAKNSDGRTALERAASGGHCSTIEILINGGADVNCSTGESGNALHGAALSGSHLAVRMLVLNGANVNAQGGEYGSALQAAAYKGNESVVKLLLDHGANVNAQGGEYRSALQAAAFSGFESIAKLLLDHGANVNAQGGEYRSALQAAVATENESITKLLLDHGANVNAQGGEFGNALQAAAAYRGNESVVKLLLDHGANVNAQGGKYGNALQAAIGYGGKESITKLLLDHGANLTCQDNQGRNTLQLAVRGNCHQVIDLILTKTETPDWSYQDLQGCSTLHIAASGASDRTLQLILQSNININLADTYGWTALHWACRNGSHETVQILRESGADSNSRDNKGWTPLDVATFCRNGSLISVFQDEVKQGELKQLISKPGKRQNWDCSSCYHGYSFSYLFRRLYLGTSYARTKYWRIASPHYKNTAARSTSSSTASMLEPPFSRLIFPTLLQKTTLTAGNDVASALPTGSPRASIRYIPPVAVRDGSTLARTKDNPDAYYTTELRTERLDGIKPYLWLAGVPSCARALHRQQLLGREILLTEDPNEHLVWHETRIFIKPFPSFLFDIDCWAEKLCSQKQLHEAACGFVLSYAWLVRHQSDLRIAHEQGLLPHIIDWETWTEFVDDFLQHIDLQSLGGISPRFQYGELRLSRLNKIYRIIGFTRRGLIRGYITAPTWYQDFFARNFAWLLAIFAFMSVALSAMQVVVAVARGGAAFEDASYSFSIVSLFVAAGTALMFLVVWVVLFAYHLVSAGINDRHVVNKRKNSAQVQGDLGHRTGSKVV
ncbi:uncharacterized protein BP5553_07530 [Venustampulla echinocandica]|uniref:Nephrocystin 3-like N-terminal domain-containing protein n=1 Tax=Venustampulla echinocandica TaxID=2656787 RepID=A0A370TGS8_9HELO|nr:uncharacterized protein BP5553_07530 [Venustampulla echinocandica]RDL34402.1 hypothetical protein BP5553_07530 [Venustampulla echinocandica]